MNWKWLFGWKYDHGVVYLEKPAPPTPLIEERIKKDADLFRSAVVTASVNASQIYHRSVGPYEIKK